MTIVTSQAPDSKPIGVSQLLSTDWATTIEVEDYEIPEEVFGSGTRFVRGVAEITAPILVCNITTSAANVSARIFRAEANTYFTVINELPIPSKDTVYLPLNGQFIANGDILEIRSSANNTLHATVSYTVGQAEDDDVI
jgi:hypothetical protein